MVIFLQSRDHGQISRVAVTENHKALDNTGCSKFHRTADFSMIYLNYGKMTYLKTFLNHIYNLN